MKKTLMMSAAISLVAMSASALELSPYLAAKMKFVDVDSEWSNSWWPQGQDYDLNNNTVGGAIAAGISKKICTGDAIRLELEYSSIKSDKNNTAWGDASSKADIKAYMLNAYYDFNLDSKFTPYISAGIGSGKARYKLRYNGDYLGSLSDRKTAWQVGFGIAYAATDHVSVDVGYRYTDYGRFTAEDNWWDINKFETTTNELYIGLRYNF